MALSICPTADVQAPLERVWSYLAQPSNYSLWWDARTVSIEPPGPAHQGQKILARTRALGLHWEVAVLVKAVDQSQHTLDLTTTLPLGVTVHTHISCTRLTAESCRVAFG